MEKQQPRKPALHIELGEVQLSTLAQAQEPRVVRCALQALRIGVWGCISDDRILANLSGILYSGTVVSRYPVHGETTEIWVETRIGQGTSVLLGPEVSNAEEMRKI